MKSKTKPHYILHVINRVACFSKIVSLVNLNSLLSQNKTLKFHNNFVFQEHYVYSRYISYNNIFHQIEKSRICFFTFERNFSLTTFSVELVPTACLFNRALKVM